MNPSESLRDRLLARPKVWLVTGCAGFIGSNLVEALLRLNQRVIGLDNYSTGSRQNLEEVRGLVTPEQWVNFLRIDGDIRDLETCRRGSLGVDYVLHQAALDSIPGSITNPDDTHASNINGFLNLLLAARDNKVRRVVYASSSSVYGDDPHSLNVETKTGRCLSPYAVTKRTNELYAEAFARSYSLESIGLRYFNVFGARQRINDCDAAIIPHWIAALIRSESIEINGDGTAMCGFCYVANVVQANLLAATTENRDAINEVYNVAVGAETNFNKLFRLLRRSLQRAYPRIRRLQPVHLAFTREDNRYFEADVSKAARLLGYQPTHTLEQGLLEALPWYRKNFGLRPSLSVRSSRRRRGDNTEVPCEIIVPTLRVSTVIRPENL